MRVAGTVRARTTIAAVVVVALALLGGGVALVLAMRHILTREVRTAARSRAAEVAAVLEAGTVPAALVVDDAEAVLIQVVDRAGSVVASSPNVAGLPPVARLSPGQSAEVRAPIDDDDFLAVAGAADSPEGRVTVVVARTLESVDESTAVVTRLLVTGLPLLLVVVGVTTWKAVGRALAPVEAMRREVDGISASELHRRVPGPRRSDEIARLAATMNRMLERLAGAHDRQQRFVSDASHELRSPVASIRQHAEVALAHPERTSITDLAGTVLAEDLRVQGLLDDLLLLARADERTLELRRAPVDLDDVVFDEARRFRGIEGLRIDTTAVSAGRVDGDHLSLRRVVRNLADNAARHTEGRVSFGLERHDGWVVLTVDDDGPGVATGDRERIFERFVRLDAARARDGGGSGLGLAIVAELVRAHGGTVAVFSNDVGGARFEVRLPALTEPADGP